MDEFWWGVVITLIVGIPGAYIMGVLAHMHTPRFVQFLERRRLLIPFPGHSDFIMYGNDVMDFTNFEFRSM
jgi:hypothetical protein